MRENFHIARAIHLNDPVEAPGISLSLISHLFILISLLQILGIL
jgi:hypothetical protein